MVPTPICSPRGKEIANMAKPTRIVTIPMETPVCPSMPWCRTFQESRPRSALMMSARPTPQMTSPSRRRGRRRPTSVAGGVWRKRTGA